MPQPFFTVCFCFSVNYSLLLHTFIFPHTFINTSSVFNSNLVFLTIHQNSRTDYAILQDKHKTTKIHVISEILPSKLTTEDQHNKTQSKSMKIISDL